MPLGSEVVSGYNEEVKTDLNSHNPYTNTLRPKVPGTVPLDPKLKKVPLETAEKDAKTSPDYKVDLSPKVDVPVPEIKTPEVSPSEVVKAEVKNEAKKEAVKEVAKVIPDVRPGSLKKNAIIFIKGMDVFSSPSKSETGYAGVGRIAESINGSRIYGWDQKDEILKEVLKVHPDYKVVLVGHSLGGDTAVEVANELDTLENKFRSVDLLITMDSVGFNNDIIPQNVKSHLNVFGENDFFLNDGPHVARRHEKTSVDNILSPKDHTDIDDDKEIQYEIVNLIQKTIT